MITSTAFAGDNSIKEITKETKLSTPTWVQIVCIDGYKFAIVTNFRGMDVIQIFKRGVDEYKGKKAEYNNAPPQVIRCNE